VLEITAYFLPLLMFSHLDAHLKRRWRVFSFIFLLLENEGEIIRDLLFSLIPPSPSTCRRRFAMFQSAVRPVYVSLVTFPSSFPQGSFNVPFNNASWFELLKKWLFFIRFPLVLEECGCYLHPPR